MDKTAWVLYALAALCVIGVLFELYLLVSS